MHVIWICQVEETTWSKHQRGRAEVEKINMQFLVSREPLADKRFIRGLKLFETGKDSSLLLTLEGS